MPAHVLLERVTRVAPFGLGLWDTATGTLVSDGIAVRLYFVSGARTLEPVETRVNRAGIFVAHGLPGLRRFESGGGDARFWETMSPPRRCHVEVRDLLGRFVPFVVRVDVPARQGLTVPPCVEQLWPEAAPDSPPTRIPYVPLFSTPSRTAPAGMTAVRATLRDADTGGPASYAMLEVRESGRLIGRGVADEKGDVVALFAYPEPPLVPQASPPVSPPWAAGVPQPLSAQRWTLDVTVCYGPAPPLALERGRPALVDLCDVVSQLPASVAPSSPPATLTGVSLRHGEELVLGAPAGAELFIRPAGIGH